ncbi:MAG: YfcE family phosphodiesterase [Elusimicrobia bacterium RIFOXYC2_FULL_34_12]|nr:MAG: YfcE family phosphodiesterase [Elusimicrobia bacterium RIFOXYC2_FULL_34_12]
MLIGIMSDSHDNLNSIKKAVNVFNERKVEIVLHAGDMVSPFTANEFEKLKSKFIAVFGNNDGDKPFLMERFKNIGELHNEPYEFELDGKKIVIMHAPKFLDELLEDKRYDIVIYGHTHRVDIRKGTSLIINPGECGGWLYGRSTIAILDTKTLNPEIVDL